MKFGLVYPNNGSFCDVDLAAKAVKLAEEYGFDSFLTWDHLLYPRTRKTFDAFLLLSSLALITKDIKLGTCVTPILLRGPLLTAKLVASLDLISKGRSILGVGAGWYKYEFDVFGRWDTSSVRVRKFSEALQLISKLFEKGKTRFHGQYYSVKNISIGPKPVRKPHPPLWVGSKRNTMISIAAKYADGWIPANLSKESYEKYVRSIKKYRKSNDLNDSFVFAHHSTIRYSYRSCSNHTEDLLEAGCEYCAINIKCQRHKLIQNIEMFAKEILPSFS